MTIFAVTRSRVENGNILGFKQTAEQVQGCKEMAPGDYHLAHGYVEMDVAVGPDDSVSIETDSIMSGRSIRSMKFGGSTFKLPALQNRNFVISVTPKFTEAALVLGQNKKGITFSLERYENDKLAPVAIGTLAIESALKPARSKEKMSATFGGGRGSG